MSDVPLKRLAVRPPEYGLNVAPAEYRGDGVRLLRTSDLSSEGTIDQDGGVYLHAGSVPREMLLEDGDVLFSRSGTIGRGFVYAGGAAIATFAGFLVRFRMRPTIDPRAIRYWSESTPFRHAVKAGAISSTIANFNAEKYGLLSVPTQLVARSMAIADYLDAEISRIDRLIGAKLRLSGVIGQRRSTFVGEVITGRHPTCRSAISVAPVRPLRVFADVTLGAARSPERMDGRHIVPYLRAGNVKNGYMELDSISEMNFTPTEQSELALRPGDVLVTEGAGSLAAVGANAVWSGEIAGVVCFQNHLLRLRATERSDPRFIAWWARFAYDSGLFASLATGAQILNLGAADVRRLGVRMPERRVQSEIADILDSAASVLDAASDRLIRQVDLLQERRQALITAAVTGQAEIPGVAA